MRALDQEVKDAVWAAAAALLPQREDSHPLGCHRCRVPDRVCFELTAWTLRAVNVVLGKLSVLPR